MAKRHRTAARDRERRRLQARAVPTSCWLCGREAATETHETIRRAQCADAAADLDYMEPLGPECHRWVTNHPQLAHELGLVLWGYERGNEEAMRAAQQARLDWEIQGRPR